MAHERCAGRAFVLGRHRIACHAAALLFGATLFVAESALGAGISAPGPFPPRDFPTYQPTGTATRIAPGEAPSIDGDLSDPAWAKAQPIDEFYQVDPNAGAPPSQITVARFLYDDDTLYVGIYAYDTEPDRIVATVRARDANADVDDGVRIYIDPEQSRRNAYYFEMNALGARVDALIQNNQTYISTWNTIWAGSAKRQPDGYSVEMAIPFKDLSFDPAQPNWGLEIQRRVRRTGERIRWSTIRAGAYYADVSQAGTLTGISGVTQGLGLDVQVYGKLEVKREWDHPDRDSFRAVTSANAYYKLTPGLTGTLTVNPDFSNSPLDTRQVNTTRFALFQPETRDFFLQDAANFEFGGRGFLRSANIGRDNGRPFFSRNIGLANGRPVGLTTGAKLSGQYEGIGVGALSVLTDGTGTARNRQVLSVARVTAPVLNDESKAGFIVTNGDPTGRTRNTVGGADVQFRDSNFFPGKVLLGEAFYQRSFSNTKGDDDSLGLTAFYPNEPWGGDIHFKQIGPNFAPALGFVNRAGIRAFDGFVSRLDRNVFGTRFTQVQTVWNVVTGLDNRIQSRENIVEGGYNTPIDDSVRVRVVDDFEAVPRTFNVADRVPVAPGDYHWTNFGFNIGTSDARPYVVTLDFLCCSFYNGSAYTIDLQLDLRPIPLLQLRPRYTFTAVKLPFGSVDIHLVTSDVIFNFTPDMQLFMQVQYDNISQKFAYAARYRWEYQPGDEFFASFGQAALIPQFIPGAAFRPQISQAIIRLGNTFRF